MPGDPAEPLMPLLFARWPEVEQVDRRLLLWPVGSTEQHGPHLPMGTDILVAAALAEQAHARFPGVGLAPPLPIGASGEHADFPGTLSIGTAALTSVVVEFVRHAGRFWPRVLVVNGHGGNTDALRAAGDQLAAEGRPIVVHDAVGGGPRADAHAGHRETSLLLYLAPQLVRLDLARPGNTTPLAELLPPMRSQGVRAVSANGILGDPTGASAEAGRHAFEGMLAALCDVIAGELRRSPPANDAIA